MISSTMIHGSKWLLTGQSSQIDNQIWKHDVVLSRTEPIGTGVTPHVACMLLLSLSSGPDHPDVAATYINHEKKTYDILVKQLGEDDSRTRESQNWMKTFKVREAQMAAQKQKGQPADAVSAQAAIDMLKFQGSKDTEEHYWLGAVHVKDVVEPQGDEGRAMKADVTNLINRSRPDAKAKGNQGTPLISHLLVYNANTNAILSSISFPHFLSRFTFHFSTLSLSLSLPFQTPNKWRSSLPMIRSLSLRKPSAYSIRMATVASPQRSSEP
ncbi:hypothetical protein L2E82_20955 [Cichorium intybus]|uniref:Uncharacterized protein n=1 Tax=Cichorium intybus TaxID=13427 RepID=A0ACB9DV38_CICIN|nr:hypothetical protein L2E82_20955 [Cichorium intybus]